MGIRTFFAIDISEAARDRLAEAQRRMADPAAKVKWVAPELLHVTMKFLGDVADDCLAEVCEAGARAAAEAQPFDFAVRRVVCVPPGGRQLRMIWVGVEYEPGTMDRLAERLENAMEPLGFPREKRKFHPHITLARVKFAEDPSVLRAHAAEFAETDFGTTRADQLVAYSSKLTPAGPIYAPLAKAPLGG